MSGFFNTPEQFHLGPTELINCLNIPTPLLRCQFRLQNDHIWSPANQKSYFKRISVTFIGTIKVPHSAQIPRRETHSIRIIGCQIFRGGHRCPFFRSGTDQFANF